MDIFDRKTIAQGVAQLYPVKMGIVDLFFSGKEEPPTDTEYVEVDVYSDKRRVGKYVKRGSPSQQIEDIGFKTVVYKPPVLFHHKATNAHLLFKRDFGMSITDTSPSAEERAYKKIGKDFEELKTIALRAQLKQVSELLQTGKVTLNESGEDRVIDFDLRDTHKITLSGTSLWSNKDANPMKDIRDWQEKIGEDSGLFPDVMILGKDAMDAFFMHPKVKEYYDNRRIVIGEMKSERLANGLIKRGEFEGTILYEFKEWFYDEESGTNKPAIDDTRIILGSTDAKTSIHYAGLEDSTDDIVYIAAEKEIAKTRVDKESDTMKAYYKTAPLYALSQSDGFLVGKVV